MRRPRSCLHPYGHRTRVEDCVGIIDINALNIPRGLSDDARASVDVSRDVDGETVESVIFLIPTYPHFGGVRWWLSCPSSPTAPGRVTPSNLPEDLLPLGLVLRVGEQGLP